MNHSQRGITQGQWSDFEHTVKNANSNEKKARDRKKRELALQYSNAEKWKQHVPYLTVNTPQMPYTVFELINQTSRVYYRHSERNLETNIHEPSCKVTHWYSL